jgi:fatty acid desaturase
MKRYGFKFKEDPKHFFIQGAIDLFLVGTAAFGFGLLALAFAAIGFFPFAVCFWFLSFVSVWLTPYIIIKTFMNHVWIFEADTKSQEVKAK